MESLLIDSPLTLNGVHAKTKKIAATVENLQILMREEIVEI
jgi:hypothetical protein